MYAIFFTTFGTLIIFIGSLLYAILTSFSILTLKHLIILFILYLVGEVCEYILVIIGAKKLGASNTAVIGALIGALVGAIVGISVFGIGLILGTFCGIFLGAFVAELLVHRDLLKSIKAGAGGVLGRVGSIMVKVIIAFIMITIIVSRVINYGF